MSETSRGKTVLFVTGVLLGVLACLAVQRMRETPWHLHSVPQGDLRVPLPQPSFSGGMALKTALVRRRSRRGFASQPMTIEHVSQLLWACQGVTSPRGFRTAPSAGALYGLQIYLVTPGLDGLGTGTYAFAPEEHDLVQVSRDDIRGRIVGEAFIQNWEPSAGSMFIVCGFEGQIAQKYGSRGRRYLFLEAGHAAQNLLLQATALDLSVGLVGAFSDRRLAEILKLRPGEEPLYVITVGRPVEAIPGPPTEKRE